MRKMSNTIEHQSPVSSREKTVLSLRFLGIIAIIRTALNHKRRNRNRVSLTYLLFQRVISRIGLLTVNPACAASSNHPGGLQVSHWMRANQLDLFARLRLLHRYIGTTDTKSAVTA